MFDLIFLGNGKGVFLHKEIKYVKRSKSSFDDFSAKIINNVPWLWLYNIRNEEDDTIPWCKLELFRTSFIPDAVSTSKGSYLNQFIPEKHGNLS